MCALALVLVLVVVVVVVVLVLVLVLVLVVLLLLRTTFYDQLALAGLNGQEAGDFNGQGKEDNPLGPRGRFGPGNRRRPRHLLARAQRREGGREGGKEGGKEGRREGRRKGRREGRKEGGTERWNIHT